MWHIVRNVAIWFTLAFAVCVISGMAYGTDYYLANKPGSGSGAKDDPFGLADLPKPDNKPTRSLAVLRPGDTLWFKGGEYAFKTGPAKDFYHVGYLRPARSGAPDKPISFRACPGETVVLSTSSGGQPIFGNADRDYIRHEGFVIKGSIGHVGGKGAEIAYCEIIGEFVDTTDNHDGIRIEHADGAWVHHNIIHGIQGKSGNSVGIKVYKSQNLIIEDNWVYDNTRGIFDKDSGINNTYRRNFLTKNRLEQFHGNNQGKYMVAHIYDNVIYGHVALGYLVDGTDVHDNLIRGDMLAGHWAGELWNTRLWNNIVITQGKAVTAYNESKNRFVNAGEKKHLAYMDYNVYTVPPKYTFGAYAQGGGQTFGMDELRSRGFELHSQVVAAAGEIFKDERSWELLPKWKAAGRDGDAVGPENAALVLDIKRYGPACREALIAPGQSIQAAVEAHPPGTTFRIQTGIHRLQHVKPKDGDRFIGEPGAVLSGAKVLPAADFVKSGNAWHIGGQTQRLGQPFGTDIMIPGFECDLNPEALFVNGDTRLKRVPDLSKLGPGKWYFDYKAGRIYLHDDPALFSLIETSAASAAFGGSGIRNVLIENLVIEKYGNPPNHGAVGSLGTTDSRYTYDWTCRYLTVRYNHGDGIDTGPGMTVENCKLHDNGQFGVGGCGIDERYYRASPSTAFKGRVTFRNNEVFRNGVLGYQRGWGAGGSKFAVQVAGTLVENCWFHDNYGPGIWFDIENRDTVIRSNLVENNGITLAGKIGGLGRGIFYEVSYGPAKIYWNISRNNQEAAILNSNSEDVEIYENAVWPNGIMVSHDNRGHKTSSKVHHNDIGRGDRPAGNGFPVGISSVGSLDDILPRVTIDSNIYRGFNTGHKYWGAGIFWSKGATTFTEWQRLGLDKNGTLLDAGTPALLAKAVPFALSQYGQQGKALPSPTSRVSDGSPSPAKVPLWGRFETPLASSRRR